MVHTNAVAWILIWIISYFLMSLFFLRLHIDWIASIGRNIALLRNLLLPSVNKWHSCTACHPLWRNAYDPWMAFHGPVNTYGWVTAKSIKILTAPDSAPERESHEVTLTSTDKVTGSMTFTRSFLVVHNHHCLQSASDGQTTTKTISYL